MDAIAVLFGGALNENAFLNIFAGRSAFSLSVERAAAFDGVTKLVLLAQDDFDESLFAEAAAKPVKNAELIRRGDWNTKTLLETLIAVSQGFDFIYYAWADSPLLDGALAAKLKERLLRYAANYAYSDGWPEGLSPELLLPSTAVFLQNLNKNAEAPVRRDALWSILQKDINSFDIETEISPVDLRPHRLTLAASSKRDTLLTRSFFESSWKNYQDAEKIIAEKPQILRTLPAFYPIMVSSVCPQRCKLCPYKKGLEAAPQFIDLKDFESLLDKIAAFSEDAVIDISLWGEISAYPERISLIEAVLARPALSLVIETCGIGWQADDIEKIAKIAAALGASGGAAGGGDGGGGVNGSSGATAALKRRNEIPALSWIVSLDAASPERYRALHGEGFDEATAFTKALLPVFAPDVYVQALRFKPEESDRDPKALIKNEDDIEAFYHFWKNLGANVIIQKYDNFCKALPDMRAGDISPIVRAPCWHIMRDMPIMLDGSVFPCRGLTIDCFSDSALGGRALGNVFSDSLEEIWARGEALYNEHCASRRPAYCEVCDEYYTYNF